MAGGCGDPDAKNIDLASDPDSDGEGVALDQSCCEEYHEKFDTDQLMSHVISCVYGCGRFSVRQIVPARFLQTREPPSVLFSCPTLPMETLYIRNLNEKVSVNTLRRLLESIFAKFGDVLQITANKNIKMKGQAFVTFANKLQSAEAMEKLQLYELFQKPIEISYAKTNSDQYFIAVQKDPETVEKRKNEKAKRELKNLSIKRKAQDDEPEFAAPPEPTKKKIKIEDWKLLPPNNVLLLQNTTVELNHALQAFFESFPGFINTRFVKARNLSFVEFESEELSTKCLQDTTKEDLLKLGPEAVLTYAKK